MVPPGLPFEEWILSYDIRVCSRINSTRLRTEAHACSQRKSMKRTLLPSDIGTFWILVYFCRCIDSALFGHTISSKYLLTQQAPNFPKQLWTTRPHSQIFSWWKPVTDRARSWRRSLGLWAMVFGAPRDGVGLARLVGEDLGFVSLK